MKEVVELALWVGADDAGRASEAHVFEGEGHIFRAEARNREWALMKGFFARHLANRASFMPVAEPQASAQGGSP